MESMYLLTGICGHLGNTLAQALLRKGCKIRGFALPQDEKLNLFKGQVEMVYGDIRSQDSLEALFANHERYEFTVIHMAGIVSIASRFNRLVHDVNVSGTRNVLALCEKYHVKKLVHVSSVHAIPERPQGQVIREVGSFDPEAVKGLYAKTKAEATQLVLEAARRGLNASVVHPSGILGPFDFGHGHLTQLVTDYMTGRLTAAVNGGYDFVDVRDVAQGIARCCEKGGAGECYILSNRYATVRAVLDSLSRQTGKRPIKTFLPMWLAKATAPLAETYYRILKQTPLYTPYSLFTLQSNAFFSHEKADRALDYATRPLDETLMDTVLWLREQKRI